MKREQTELIHDSSHLAHAVCTIGGEVVREVIEIRTGVWNPEAMSYLAAAGDRLKDAGFEYRTVLGDAEKWTRYEFRRIN